MAFKKDNKIKSNFNRISIGLASPEENPLQRYSMRQMRCGGH